MTRAPKSDICVLSAIPVDLAVLHSADTSDVASSMQSAPSATGSAIFTSRCTSHSRTTGAATPSKSRVSARQIFTAPGTTAWSPRRSALIRSQRPTRSRPRSLPMRRPPGARDRRRRVGQRIVRDFDGLGHATTASSPKTFASMPRAIPPWILGEPMRTVLIDDAYVDTAMPLIRQRLKQAGVRLALYWMRRSARQ